MKWIRNRSFLIIVFVAVGVGFGAFMAVKAQSGLGFTMFRLEKWVRQTARMEKPVTKGEKRQARKSAEAAVKRALVKSPDLRIEPRSIPPEENGFFKACELSEDAGIQRLQDSGILGNLTKTGKSFDPAAIRFELVEHEAIGSAIIAVAEMKQRSSAFNVGSALSLPSAKLKAMSDYLLLLSRVGAAEGDADSSLKYISFAVNFSEHLRDIEHPTLLSETVVILLELAIRATFFEHILPDLRGLADLEKYRSALGHPDYTPARYAGVLRGEWFNFGEEFAHLVFIESGREAIPDPESFIAAYTAFTSKTTAKIQSMQTKDLLAAGLPGSSPQPSSLSFESKGLIEMMEIGAKSWFKGMFSASARIAQFDAALDLLIRESRGKDLSGLSKSFLLNPITELPFDFNPLTRELTTRGSSSGYEPDPLKLPEL